MSGRQNCEGWIFPLDACLDLNAIANRLARFDFKVSDHVFYHQLVGRFNRLCESVVIPLAWRLAIPFARSEVVAVYTLGKHFVYLGETFFCQRLLASLVVDAERVHDWDFF